MKNRLTKRNTNFSPSDIKLLLALVGERKLIINSKRTDRINSQVKEDCWQAIQKAFNAKSSVFRTSRELKKKYENVKSMAKKKQISEGNIYNYIHNTLPNSLIMEGDSSGYVQPDGSPMQKQLTTDFKADNICKDVPTNSDSEDGTSTSKKKPSNIYALSHIGKSLNEHDCSRLTKIQNTSAMSQKEVDFTLKDFMDCTSSWSKYAGAKVKLIESKAQAEMKMLQEEHNIKMRHLEERHRMEMEKTAIELEILKANLELKRKELGEHINSNSDYYIKSTID